MKTIKEIIDFIVPEALKLNYKHISDFFGLINYSAIFCQSDDEYADLTQQAARLGNIVDDTLTGPLFKLNEAMDTAAGPLQLIKIRKPDSTHPERGDADFTLSEYEKFKKKYISDKDHFKVITRQNFEMIELHDPRIQVLSYFSNPPLTEQFGIKLV